MPVMKTTITAGLAALTVAGALAATAPAAQARDYHRNLWPGVAAGVAGGLIGGAIIAGSQRPIYVEPEYEYAPPPPPRVYYRAQYAPRCHYEWVENQWGVQYRARICPRY